MYVDYFFNCLPVYKIYCNLFKEVVDECLAEEVNFEYNINNYMGMFGSKKKEDTSENPQDHKDVEIEVPDHPVM